MKCIKCREKNITNANYCTKCGYKFSDEEKKKKNIFTVILDFLKFVYNVVTLKIFTDSNIVQVAYVVGVFCLGIYMLFSMGIHLKVLDSSQYEVLYNKDSNVYYVLLDDNVDASVLVNMYVPNKISTFNVSYYKENGSLIENNKLEKDNKVTLAVNQNTNNYYVISDSDDNNEYIKVFIYYKNMVSGGENE